MSVTIDIVALIIPIRNIERVYPGGFEKYKTDNSNLNKRLFDYDEHLVRIGAMDSKIIEGQIRNWEQLGLIAHDISCIPPLAADFCFVTNWKKVKTECPWLKVVEQNSTVSWKEIPDMNP